MLDFIVRKRWHLTAALLLATALSAIGIPHAIVPDNSITVWFPKDDPTVRSYERFHDHFGNDEVVLLQVHEPQGVLARPSLLRLQRLTRELEQVSGVARVHSIVTVKDALDTPEGIVFKSPISNPLPQDDAALEQMQKLARHSVMFRDRLLSADATRTLVWIEMAVSPDLEQKRGAIVARLREVADEVLGAVEHPMAGFGVTYAGIDELTKRDFVLFLGFSFTSMLCFLWWVFQTKRFVLATFGVMLCSSTVALGGLGLAGHRINMVTAMLPTLILVLGISDAIHMPAAFVQEMAAAPGLGRLEIAVRTLRRVALPCLLTSLTTMMGFASLAVSPMAVMSHLGWFAALGMGVAFLLTLLFMVLAFMSPKPLPVVKERHGLDWVLRAVHRLLANHSRAAVWMLVAMAGLGALGAWQVRADTYSLGYLPNHSRIVRDHESIVRGWGHYSPLDYTIVPKAGYSADSPELVAAIERFVFEANRLPEVHYGFSVHDFYRSIAQAFGGRVENNVPLAPAVHAQVGLLVESQVQNLVWDRSKSGFSDNFMGPFRTQRGDLVRATLVVDMMTAEGFADLLKRLEPVAERTLGTLATVVPSGYLPLYVSIIDYVVSSQVQSFFLALGGIFLIMLCWLRSWLLALLTLIPNIFPVLVMLGVMGALHIDLDIATATVAAIVLGVAIDNTIHFVHYYAEGRRDGMSWEDATAHTFACAGRQALITTLSLFVGFPILMFASVKPVSYFGLLTTVATAAALIGDLFMLPLLLRLVRLPGQPARRAALKPSHQTPVLTGIISQGDER